MATHTLSANPTHSVWDSTLPPRLAIASGDTVIYRTLDAGWNLGAAWAGFPEDRPRKFEPRDPERLAFVTQTTLSVDDTRAITEVLKRRFPSIVGPV